MTTTPIPTGPTGPTGATGPNKLLIALIAVGAVLVLAIAVIVGIVVGQNGGNGGNDNAGAPTPLSSQTPATPVAEPTDGATDSNNGGGGDGQAPADNSLRFTSFNANQQVACDSNADEKAQPQISWSAANAVAVYWTPNDDEATAENGYEVGSSGNQNDMSASKGPGERYEFPCNHRETFDTTITIYGSNGESVSKTVTFTDINWGSDSGDDEDE
jgi:hypothetical protein